MRSKLVRRAFGTFLVAWAAVMAAPVPAHADFVCWMSDGIRYCYDDGDRQVPAAPDPVPVEEPPFVPAPVPAPAPAVVEQPRLQPVPVPADPAPAIPIPAEERVPVKPLRAPVYLPAQPSGYNLPAAQAPWTPAAEAPVEAAPEAPLAAEPESGPESKGTVDVPVPTVSPSLTAAASPAPAAPAAANRVSEQSSSAGRFDALPLTLAVAAVLLVAAVVWLVPPARTAILRVGQVKL